MFEDDHLGRGPVRGIFRIRSQKCSSGCFLTISWPWAVGDRQKVAENMFVTQKSQSDR